MTRDEAIIIARENWVKENTGWSESIIDTLSALGILKLDEPKAPYEILSEELQWGANNTRFLKETLDRCGLRVVRT